MPWLAWLVADSEAKRCIAETRLCGRASRLRPRLQSVMCLVRAPRQARRRAGRWYCKLVSSVVCYGEYELSGTDLLALTPLQSTILIRRRHSWVMPRRPRARDLEMPGFGRANTLNRTMAKEGTYSMMTLMRILPPTAGGGCTDAALSLYNITVFSFFCGISKCEPYSDTADNE